MTPPEHILIGFSIANIFYSVQKILNRTCLPYLLMVVFAVMFAVLPDIDSFFGSYASTSVYSGHRGVTHSIAFILLASAAAIPAAWIFRAAAFQGIDDKQEARKMYAAFFALVFAAGLSHLLADLPQPAGPWGGIPLLYPYRSNGTFVRSGGWGRLGWYDYQVMWTFIYAALASAMAIVFIYSAGRMQFGRVKKILAVLLFAVNLGAFAWLVDHVKNSEYVSARHWDKVQDEYLSHAGPLVRGITISGRDFFLRLFFRVR